MCENEQTELLLRKIGGLTPRGSRRGPLLARRLRASSFADASTGADSARKPGRAAERVIR